MSQRNMRISYGETAPPLTAGQFLSVRLMMNQLSSNRLSVDGQTRKPMSEMPKTLKIQGLSSESLKLKSKVKDLCYNCSGSFLLVACRDSVSIIETETLTLHGSLAVRCVKILRHPTNPNLFALLVMEGPDKLRPCIKVYALTNSSGEGTELKCTISSAFDDAWYSGSWSVDGTRIAVVDRGDRLQHIDVTTFKNTQLDPETAVMLSSEVYGVVYTHDGLVVLKVDGKIEIFTLDFSKSVTEHAHCHIALAADYNHERKLLATGGSDHIINLFSCADDYTCIGTYPGLEGKVSSLSFSSDGMLLAWGTKDTVFGSVNSANASAEGSAEEDYYLTVGGTNPCEIYTQHKMPTAVTHVQFAPNSYTLAYACDLDMMPKNSHTTNAIGLIRLQP